jgi:catechol 2,3-dioxygenase-like lactoylglutathione lyase family enzyme
VWCRCGLIIDVSLCTHEDGLWVTQKDQRWHFDLWLAPEAAEERIAAAVAAGGSVVDDSQAPSFTVLADPDGNKVCVCTCLERD